MEVVRLQSLSVWRGIHRWNIIIRKHEHASIQERVTDPPLKKVKRLGIGDLYSLRTPIRRVLHRFINIAKKPRGPPTIQYISYLGKNLNHPVSKAHGRLTINIHLKTPDAKIDLEKGLVLLCASFIFYELILTSFTF